MYQNCNGTSKHRCDRVLDVTCVCSIPSLGSMAKSQPPPKGLPVVTAVAGVVDCNFVVLTILRGDTAHGAGWVAIASVAVVD